MRLISHRGNISGRNPEKENSKEYIQDALNAGYDVEVDIWYVDNRYFFGHDNPNYEIEKHFIDEIKDRCWFHCKNEEALCNLGENFNNINYFWHEGDKYTLTSKGYIWAYPGEKVLKNSITLYPENYPENENKILLSSGICSDYISNYQIYKNIEKIEHDEYNILLKLTNPIYNFFTHSQKYDIAGRIEIKSFYSELILIHKNLYRDTNTLYYDHIFPTVIGFDKSNYIEEESVFIYPFTPRYYHNLVELFPKLIKLKKIDPNFVLIFVSWQHQDKAATVISKDQDDTKDYYYN
jgi:hypothetical protein